MSRAVEIENDEVPLSPGRFALAMDDGYRVVFRRADGARAWSIFWVATAVVLGITLAALLGEPEFSPIAWGIAGLMDFAAIYVFHVVRKGVSHGGLIVDGAEKRIFLPQGAEMTFDRLLEVVIRDAGKQAELILVHDGGEIPFGPRPPEEVREAAAAVARVGEIPLRSTSASAP